MTMLNINDIRKFEVNLPKDEILELFFETTIAFFKQKQVLTHQNEQLKEARDILLPRLMNRTIEVSAEVEVAETV